MLRMPRSTGLSEFKALHGFLDEGKIGLPFQDLSELSSGLSF